MSFLRAAKTGNVDFFKRNFDEISQSKYTDYQLLNIAIRYRNDDLAEYLIKRGCRVNRIDENDKTDTPLHSAMGISKCNIIDLLIQKNASIEAKNEEGDTPLHLAFKEYCDGDYLLSHTVDYYLVDDYELSNLHIACTTDRLDIIQSIIKKHNIDINSKVASSSEDWPGFSPLHFAVYKSRPKVVKWLIEHGADVNAADSTGSRPFHLTLEHPQTGVLDILVSNLKVQNQNLINKNHLSYLHVACAHGSINLIEKLLKLESEENMSINSTVCTDMKYNGFTALHFAVNNNHIRAVELLLKYGADFTLMNSQGLTPLHLAYHKRYNAIVDLILSVKNFDYNVNPTDGKNLSYFHIACLFNKVAIIKGFIDAKSVDINARVAEDAEIWSGCTALHMAVECENASMVKLLLEAGADPNISESKNQMIPLHFACRYTEFKADRLKSSITRENFLDVTVASQTNRREIVRLLKKHKANINARDKFGKTALLHLYDTETDRLFRDCIPEIIYTQQLLIKDILRGKRTEIAKELMGPDADLRISDNDGLTFLHVLADSNDFDAYSTVRVLVESNRVDVNAKTLTGLTPLFLASRLEKAEPIVGLLLEHGADPNVIENSNLSTPLHNYVEMFLDSFRGGWMFRKFVELGADVNHRLRNGKNVLHVIFSRSSNSYRKYYYGPSGDNFSRAIMPLFTLDCDLNAQDQNGSTALHYAAQFHDASDLELLLNQGADVDILDNEGKTPLNYCSERNCLALEFLIAHVEKLQTLGCYVTDQNLEAAQYIKQNYLLKKRCIVKSEEDIKNEKQELENLKEIKLDKFTSLYGILFKSPTELVPYIKNPIFCDAVGSYEFEQKFPWYLSLLRRQYRRGFRRNLLLEPAKDSLIYLTEFYLPDNCSEQILNFLDDETVKRLIDAKSNT